jgi:tetratricopeptide (TPR) repeat protein
MRAEFGISDLDELSHLDWCYTMRGPACSPESDTLIATRFVDEDKMVQVELRLLYVDLGRLDEAKKMYQRALQGYDKAWGPEHISTLDTVYNLGALYAGLGRLDEAEKRV